MFRTLVKRTAPMAGNTPYRLQIFLSDEIRMGLRDAAHEEYVSMQKLVEGILTDYLATRTQHRKKEHDVKTVSNR